MFFSLNSWAESYYLPTFCKASDLVLEVTNTSLESESLWIEIPIEDQVDETHFLISPKSIEKIRWSEYYDQVKSSRIKTRSTSLKIKALCKIKNEEIAIPLNTHAHSLVEYSLEKIPVLSSIDLYVLNLYPGPQKIQITQISSSGEILDSQEDVLSTYYETLTFKIKKIDKGSKLIIKSEARMNSLIIYSANQKPFWLKSQGQTTPRPEPSPLHRYFLMAPKNSIPRDYQESYIIRVQDETLINKFREQIQNPALEKIIFASASLAKQSYNRNLFSKKSAPYSWEISQVVNFGDFGPISCDGSPDLFEERILEKINQGLYICFWKYRAVKELSLEEVR
ncbi:MAG TPA: hypothetical protein PLJ21_13340 [Pseudobdellovibrionaceae bacterium]|nr:hypothetical protein [Pseudobdellovibrionaceae bacterium]